MKNLLAKAGLGLSSLVAFGMANAAIDTVAVDTAIDAAVVSAETVGGYVIAAVATLVVVGLIIGLVRKL